MSVTVFPRHVRSAGLCTKGARDWFAKYGFDWNRFLVDGLPGETLLETEDPLAARAVAVAEREAARG